MNASPSKVRRLAMHLPLLAVLGIRPSHAATSYLPSLDSQVDLESVPADLVRAKAGGAPIGERIRVKQVLYQEIKNDAKKDIGAKITLDLLAREVFELDLPGLESVASVAFGEGVFHAEVVMRQEHSTNPAEDYPFILTILPGDKQVSLRFKSDVLKPVQPQTYQPYSGEAPVPAIQLSVGVKIQIRYSWEGEPEVQLIDSAGLRPRLSLNTPVAIGDTGLVLEIEDAEIDLSRTTSPPGLPASWIGVKFRRLAINFVNGLDVPRVEHGEGAAPPPPTMAGVSVTDFSIGSGGVTGGICGNLGSPPTIPLFGSNFRLDRICVTLEQGALTGGEASGLLQQFPYFNQPVRLTLALALDGNFKVSLAPSDPAHPSAAVDLPIPGVLVFHVEALSIEKKGDVYTWKTSGKLNINAISTAPQDAVGVNGLSISSKGDVMLEGGWLVLPGKKTIDFKGYAVELAEIGFGTESPDTATPQAWVGFTGGIQLSEGFDAAARFKRLQFLWPGQGSAVDVRLGGIEVSFSKPGVLTFQGALDYFKDPATGAEGFGGAVACNIEAIRLAIAARLVVGKANPPGGTPFPIFYLDLAASLPTGIPLFSNVSLYGLLGLFGYGVTPNLAAFTTPVQWYQAHLAATNVLAGAPAPWRAQSGAFAIGAGVIVGTSADDGFTVNAKLALMVSLPGPIVMFQGAANVLKQRGELVSGGPPQFVCLAIFDGPSNTFLLNLGAHYTVDKLIDIRGEAEAFFNLSDPSDWHLWIGKDQPEERRIQAQVLSLIKASAYFMVDPTSFRQGAKAGYAADWKFGPLRVALEAFFGYDMSLFYRPINIWGQAELKGNVELSAFGVGVGLCADVTLEGQTPNPYFVDGNLHVKLSLPWPLPDPEASVRLHWEHQSPKAPVDELVRGFGIEPRKWGPIAVPDSIGLSGDSSRTAPPTSIAAASLCTPDQSVQQPGAPDVRCSTPLVPQDVMLVAGFQRPTNDPNNEGYGNVYDPANPLLDTINDTQFEYRLTALDLVQAKKGASTLTFDTPLTDLYGAWPALGVGVEPTPLSLKVLSRNPLELYKNSTYLFYDGGSKGWTEWATGRYGSSYCEPKHSMSTTGSKPKGCSFPSDMLTRVDFVLPPYSAFRLTVDGEVIRNTSGPTRAYRNSAIFHTEGPPLDLGPYVYVATPSDDRRPHFRSYDLGLRFNDTYLDLLYRQDGQLLELQLLDENDRPVSSAGSDVHIQTEWDQAGDHVPRPTEGDWLQYLRDHGVAVDSVTPRDNRIFGRISLPDAIRPGERYKVRVWLEDDRLTTDTRLAGTAWRASNPVRYFNGNRAVLYEFPVLMSRFLRFDDLVGSYRGSYITLAVSAAANRTALATMATRAAGAVVDFPAVLSNASASELGRFLRHVLSPRGPEAVTDVERAEWITRAPGYSGKPDRMSASERRDLEARWTDALDAFGAIEQELGIETTRRPLPKTLELRVLVQGADVIGWLVDLPEVIDIARLKVQVRPVPGAFSEVAVVPNRDSTRFFVFDTSGGSAQSYGAGLYLLRFQYARSLGNRYPTMRHRDGQDGEAASLSVSIPDDLFVPEVP